MPHSCALWPIRNLQGKKAKCVSKCVGVKCLSKRKPRCIVSRKGQPVCVRPKSRSML